MIDTPVVWVQPAAAAAPSVEAEGLLARFAAARGFRLVHPGDGGTNALTIDPRVVADIEGALMSGRDAIARLDADGVERAAAHALTTLHAHPELPQAAWLAAEAHRLLATRFRRAEPRDVARSDREWRTASALDGGRAAALGEPEGVSAPDMIDVPFVHPSDDAIVAIDGASVTTDHVKLGVGEHHVLIHRKGRAIAAAWFGIADATPLRFAPPTAPACSGEDLSSAAITPDGVSAPGARCATWLAADGSTTGVLRVAVCNGATCGAFYELRASANVIGPVVPPSHPFPVWIPITLGVVAAAVATTLVLWAAGAFDGRATVVRFDQGNVDPTSHLP